MLLSVSKTVTNSATQLSTNASVVLVKPDEASYKVLLLLLLLLTDARRA